MKTPGKGMQVVNFVWATYKWFIALAWDSFTHHIGRAWSKVPRRESIGWTQSHTALFTLLGVFYLLWFLVKN